MSEHVLVAVDGSESSNQAVRLAARLAGSRGEELRVVHAFVWPMLGVPIGPPPFGPEGSGLLNAANQILADSVELARATAAGVPIDGEIVTGSPVPVLVGESGTATVTVVGDRGLGGFASLMLGSVAVELSHYATGPVIIARGDIDRVGPVVVGLDASDDAVRALRWAAQEATRRGVEVVAVHAYPYAVSAYPGLPPMEPEEFDEQVRRQVEEQIATVTQDVPGLVVRPVLVRDTPARVLVEESKSASLLVVGTRGVGALRGLVLGSVSHAVMHHADCPVAIVR